MGPNGVFFSWACLARGRLKILVSVDAARRPGRPARLDADQEQMFHVLFRTSGVFVDINEPNGTLFTRNVGTIFLTVVPCESGVVKMAFC